MASAVLNMQAVLYGDAAVSAITIANKLYVFVRNLVIGIGQGFQPVAGYNYSAGKRRRAWQAFWFSSLVGTVLCTVCAIVMAIFARPILWWFLQRRGGRAHRCRDAALLVHCAAAAGRLDVRQSALSVPRLPHGRDVPGKLGRAFSSLPAVLLLPLWLHCAGVEMSQPVADLLTFVISMPFLAAFYRHHIRGHAE